MTKEQQKKFDLLNTAWSMLEPHVNDKEPYRKLMGEVFKAAYKKIPNRYSDEWWSKTVDMFLNIAQQYKGTQYEDFAGELTIAFCDYYEYEHKLNRSSDALFYKTIAKPFINEWERIERGEVCKR